MIEFLKAGLRKIRLALQSASETVVIESPAGLQLGQAFVPERRGAAWVVTRSGRVHYGPFTGSGAYERAYKCARSRNHMLLAIENRRIRERYATQNHAS